MAYQGEDWFFTIKGDEIVDLDDADFKVLLHPCGDEEKYVSLAKVECRKVATNVYEGKIKSSKTSQMPEGIYSIEVLLFTEGGVRTILKKDRAFYNEETASKLI